MITILQKILFIFFLAASSIASANEQDDLKDIVKRVHRHYSFHGNILIKRGNDVVLKESFGQAIREWNIPHSLDSKFMIASLSKQFTAFAILQLEDEGQLSLDDSISKYIKLPKNSPVSQEKWEQITIRHLITHSAGLMRDVKRTPSMSTSDYNLVSAIVSNTLKDIDVIFKPLGNYHYSNFGYLLLAQIIESVSKKFYENYLRINIFMKLKMFNTGEYHRRKSISFMADGYFYNESNRINKRCCHDATVFTGSHSLYSDVSDLEKWWQEIHIDKKIFSSKLIEKFLFLRSEVDEHTQYGFGLFHDEYSQMKRVYHTGHEWGFVSLISYVEELDLTIIYLSNLHGHDIFSYLPNHARFHQEIIDYYKNL